MRQTVAPQTEAGQHDFPGKSQMLRCQQARFATDLVQDQILLRRITSWMLLRRIPADPEQGERNHQADDPVDNEHGAPLVEKRHNQCGGQNRRQERPRSSPECDDGTGGPSLRDGKPGSDQSRADGIGPRLRRSAEQS